MRGIRVAVLCLAVVVLASSAAKRWEPFTPGERTSDSDDAALTTAAGQVMTDYGLTVQSAVGGLVTTEWAVLTESVEASMGDPNAAPQARWVTTIRSGSVRVAIQCRYRNGTSCDGKLPNGAKWSAQADEMAEAIVRAAGG